MKKLLILLPFLLLISCGVQKRKYQKGFYISWHKPVARQKEKQDGIAKSQEIKKDKAGEEPATVIKNEPEITAAGDNQIPTSQIKKKTRVLIGDDPCDDIIFRDGSEIKGRVTEITEKEIKYKKCDMADGPVYIAKKSDVFMVKYANGTRETFKAETAKINTPAKPAQNYDMLPIHPSAVAALVLGIIGVALYIFIVPSALAVVFGNKALREIKAQPGKFRGNGQALTGKIMGFVGLGMGALFLLILAISLGLFI